MSQIVTLNIYIIIGMFSLSYIVGYLQGRNLGRMQGFTGALDHLTESELGKVLMRIRKAQFEQE